MGSGSSSIPQDKHLLIIGAGYGGIHLALSLLKKNSSFTIVDSKDSFHHNVASVRAVVEPGFARKIVIPYAPTFGKHFKHGKVTKIDTGAKLVTLEDGTELAYDILIISTGSYGPMKESEGTGTDIIAKYSKIADEVEKSQNVVIIGGGAVGVEVAGEVATIYKDKKVTIVQNTPQLVSADAPAAFLEKVMAIIRQLKINVVLDETVENLDELPHGIHGSYKVKTTKGNAIEADIVLVCTGLKVNSAAYASALKDHMEANGALKVNEFFQVEGFKDIFAFGDCCNAKEPKLAYVAGLEADLVVKNVANVLNNRPLEPWKPGSFKLFMGLSMGSRHGVIGLKSGFVLPEFIIVDAKSKDLMVGRFFKEMKQTVPK